MRTVKDLEKSEKEKRSRMISGHLEYPGQLPWNHDTIGMIYASTNGNRWCLHYQRHGI